MYYLPPVAKNLNFPNLSSVTEAGVECHIAVGKYLLILHNMFWSFGINKCFWSLLEKRAVGKLLVRERERVHGKCSMFYFCSCERSI